MDQLVRLMRLHDLARQVELPAGESGWVSREELTDIDRESLIIDHTTLYGATPGLRRKATVKSIDSSLAGYGLPKRRRM